MLAVAEARHGNAKEKYDRVAKLQEDGLISRQELDDASAELKEAVGELNDAQTALRQTEVRAPFAGEVGLREISLGAYVSSGERIVQLTQTDPLRLVVGLPQRSVASLRVGQQVRGVAGDCTERFRGQLSVIDPTLDVATRSVRFQARIPNPEGQLRPGMSARVAVEIDQIENAITVPQEAVIRRGTKTLVYTVEDDGSVGTREIVLGQYFVDRVEVASGLRINEKVIVAGHQKLRPDSRIDPQPFERVSNANLQLGFQSIATACEF
jgi:membrane fusion protein (multidrug efflux system)